MTHSAVIRRSLPPAAVLRRSLSSLVPALSSPPLLKPSISYSSPSSLQQPSSFLASIVQSRLLRSYPTVSLSSDKKYHLYKEGDEITPDTILFEGCDYNHWLIVMEFPKDPKPTPEEMVRTYEETCAKGLNISLEEAKQKIYACSTTTYQGFQAVMTEEESEKFQGLPGVVFVLPDSYIDPQNKEYGGDKYINGTIIPRPPPIQRNTGGRFRDRNRNPDRPPRYNQQGGPMQNQQIYPQNNSWQGDVRNPGAPQNYPQQQNYSPQQNYPPEQNYSPQQNYPPERNSPPQQNYPPLQSFGTPGQGVSGGPMPMNRSGRESFPVDRRGSVPPYPGNYNQGEKGKYYSPQGDQSGYGQRNFVGNNSNYAPPSHGGTYGQEDQSNYGPRNFMGNNSNYAPPSHGGTYGQGVSSNYGQSYRGQGENQRFSPMDQGNVQGDQRNYAPTGQTGTNQG